MRALAALALAFLLAGISGASAQDLPAILVGATPSDGATPALYAVRAGLFRQAGLNVTVQKTPNGAAGTAAVIGGTFQIADTNLVTVITAHTKGVPIELVAPDVVYNSTTEWAAGVAKTGIEITSGRDLNGKLLGVATIGDANGMALMNWIDKTGGDSRTVKMVEVPYPLVAPALEQGRIDAAILLQPFLSQATESGKVHVFAKVFDAISARFQMTVFIANSAWAAANPDLVRRFARVMRTAQIYANGHRTETAPLLAEWANVDTDTILRGKRATYAANITDPREIQPWIDVAVKYGLIAKAFYAGDMISPAVRGMTP